MAADLLSRLPELEREAQEYERKAYALRQIIDGVRALNGDAARLFAADTGGVTPPGVGLDPPRGRDAVRRIVEMRPGQWRVRDIKREVRLRGWPSSPNAIDTAVARLAESGEAERIGKGLYLFRPNGLEASAPVSGDAS